MVGCGYGPSGYGECCVFPWITIKNNLKVHSCFRCEWWNHISGCGLLLYQRFLALHISRIISKVFYYLCLPNSQFLLMSIVSCSFVLFFVSSVLQSSELYLVLSSTAWEIRSSVAWVFFFNVLGTKVEEENCRIMQCSFFLKFVMSSFQMLYSNSILFWI